MVYISPIAARSHADLPQRQSLTQASRGATRSPGGLSGLLGQWAMRWRGRRALADLDDRLLNDIGLTPGEARRESAVGFWRP